MNLADRIGAAIAQHDAVTLRRIAEQAEQKETRMVLALLADILDDHRGRNTPSKNG